METPMSHKDVIKVILMLAFAAAVVAAYCYARVDLGMTVEQVNVTLQSWFEDSMLPYVALIVALAVPLVGKALLFPPVR